MIKSELVARIAAENPHLNDVEAQKVVYKIIETISEGLERGDRIELRGFGTFSVRHRQGGRRRNPSTGEIVYIEAKSVPFFKTGRGLHRRLNFA